MVKHAVLMKFIFFLLYYFIFFLIYKAKAVGSACISDTDCGADMTCKGKRCECNEGFEEVDDTDSSGRPTKTCKSGKK